MSRLPKHGIFKPLLTLSLLRRMSMALALCGSIHGSALGQDMDSLLHSVVLDPDGKYVMSWTPGPDDVTIEVQVETRGYVGLGFSPSGGMKGADIVLGWVDKEGETHLTDRHAIGNKSPLVDDSQDVTLISGRHNGTHTILRFKRPWDTCDKEHDLVITSDTIRVIYAYNDDTPSLSSSVLPYHVSRGTKSIYMKNKQTNIPEPSGDEKHWDVLAPDVLLPAKHSTLYWCKIYKLPQLPRKHHFIRFKPLISKESLPFLHHMILNECHLENSHEELERWVDHGGSECFAPSMPVSWRSCNTPLLGWGIGSEGGSHPPHVGTPLGEEWNGATYFLLEIHYDNPGRKEGIRDSSGLRVIYSPNLRQFDSGIFTVGHLVDPSLIIGPRTSDWVTEGHCPGACTAKGLPSGGIHVFKGFLHSHLLGRRITVQHIRDGRELPPIIEDHNYDFNYQEGRTLPNERTVLPRDHLLTSCHYDSSGRQGPTFGGLSTQEEMCLAFLSYYPRTGLSECISGPEMPLLLGAIGVQEISVGGVIRSMSNPNAANVPPSGVVDQQAPTTDEKDLSVWDYLYKLKITQPSEMSNRSILEVLRDPEFWVNRERVAAVQQVATSGSYRSGCYGGGHVPIKGTPAHGRVPVFEAYTRPVGLCGAHASDASHTFKIRISPRSDSSSGATSAPPSNVTAALGINLTMQLP